MEINEHRKQQEAEDLRRITATRERDILAGAYLDIHGVLPGSSPAVVRTCDALLAFNVQ
jgi:hypothetical protein